MRRRTFLWAIGGASTWPLVARAQGTWPTVGFLASGSPETFTTVVTGFLDGLKQAGFSDGHNLAIEYRWAKGQFNLLPSLADELTKRPVDILVTMGGNVAALAAKRATSTIPVVFLTGDDPVSSGLVDSLNRPGSNVTGVTWLAAELGAKNLELIRELLPAAAVIGVLVNPNRPTAEAQLMNAKEAADGVGKTLRVLYASSRDEIDKAFATIAQEHVGVLFVTVDPLFIVNRIQIIEAAAKQAVPTLYFQREFVDLGGLMSYGASAHDASRLVGGYAGRIIKGDKPADLPVQRSTKIETIINLKTAKSLGLVIPSTLLARADEVIE
jgi:putative tryptophan/tyrosine transport system substrate-binding protein